MPGVIALAVVCSPVVGCAMNATLDARMAQIGSALGRAEALGAMRCAPRELAIAQSQLAFARLEREQGDIERSVAHLDRADENVRAAEILTAAERCPAGNDSARPPPEPRASAAPAP